MLPSTSLCAHHAVRANNVEMAKFGAEKGVLQDHGRRLLGGSCIHNPRTPRKILAKLF